MANGAFNQLMQYVMGKKKKQAELGFLGETSAEVSSQMSLQELLSNTLSLTGEFFEADVGVCLTLRNGEEAYKNAEVWVRECVRIDEATCLNKVIATLPLHDVEVTNTWFVTDVESISELQAKWMVYTNLTESNDRYCG